MDHEWGSPELTLRLRGGQPDGRPHAEVWMGTHPVAPSFAVPPDGLRPLPDLVRGSPEAGAGDGRQGGLPLLVKLLAASAPLSLLVHPSTAQTEVRYVREEAAGIFRDGSAPCYRDRSHKPEMFLAFTRFDLPRSFRPPRDAAAELTALGVARLAEAVDPFCGPDTEGRSGRPGRRC